MAAMVGTFTSAIFTDSATMPSSTFSTGTVDIDLSDSDETNADNLVTSDITFSAMAPGDQVTAPITVTNNGSLDLRYAVTSTTTENVLAAELDMTIKSGVTTCTDAGFGASGTVEYGAGDLGSTTGTNVIGNPTQGADAGDRTLAAGASEVLCFNVKLPLAATNASQGVTTTATFDFQAEQTKNN
jgi:hypothetical protein